MVALVEPVIVLDSSAIASIFFKDRLEKQVVETIENYERFKTLDIAFAEIASVAWKSVVIFKQSFQVTSEALKQATSFIQDNCDVVSSREVISEAFELGTKHNIQVYDSSFLSLARKLECKVLTTDERLHNKVKEIKELRGLTILGSA
ncbi:MAG: type II toxin-antitoxin system VapC family toxin [Nitrososphaerales archaeon]